MRLKLRYYSGLFALLMILTVGWQSSIAATQIPELTFKSIEGDVITSADLKGHPVLLVFWATDCSSCMQEIPELIDLYRDYENTEAKILAVAMYYDPPNRVVSISKGMQLPYSVIIDPQAKLTQALNVLVTPTHILVNPDGSIEKRVVGLMSSRDIRTFFDQALAEQAEKKAQK